ncbi:MAG: hypothetical protein LBE21_03650 [Pseudomonadales bacterium]|jgi:hypothetical protein|nr:hypothetical protein [Pseudomonadales bacterium]
MRLPIRGLFILGLASGLASFASAQEGHPAKGSWIGEWKGNSAGESVLMVMNWDGQNITGIINPGTDNLQISDAQLNPADWTIHIAAGDYVIDGAFARLELPNRSIVGTWKRGNDGGDFEIVRQ